MATQKQLKTLNNLVENGGNVSKAMRDAGYSEATARTPQKYTLSKGFGEACERLGLNYDIVVFCLIEDIVSKPGNRRSELELATKILLAGNQNKAPEEQVDLVQQRIREENKDNPFYGPNVVARIKKLQEEGNWGNDKI